MRPWFACMYMLALSACATTDTDELDRKINESRIAFEQAIPVDWTPENFPVRVISDYKSKGSQGIVAMDNSNVITTFELCDRRTRKCYDEAAVEAVANCENTVHLGLMFDIFGDKVPECRVVIVNDRFVHVGNLTINGVEYVKGDKI